MGRQGESAPIPGGRLPTRSAGPRTPEQHCGQAVRERLTAAALSEALAKLLGDDVDADCGRDAGVELDFYLVFADFPDGALGQKHF